MPTAPRWLTASSPDRPSSTAAATASSRRLFTLCLFSIVYFSACASALLHVPNSPCESLCADARVGTLHDDVRCLVEDYDISPGLALKECVTCQLNSTAVDTATGASDVKWALYNLRYALSNCMFAYPEERISISSPCQVTCAPLQRAVTTDITNATQPSDIVSDFDYCTNGRFDDTTINNCAFCYSLIDEQRFLGNFLQTLHIACHSPPENGNTFYPDGVAVFNDTAIAGPTGAAPPPPPSSGLSRTSLILVIVLPIVGGLLILIGVCFGCWHFTRKRRHEMAASGRMSKFHDSQVSMYSPVTPGVSGQPQWHQPPTEMQRISVTPKMSDGPSKQSPGQAQGRWSHQGQYDDGAGVPLNSADREAFAISNAGLGIEPQPRHEPHAHEQQIGVADGGGQHLDRGSFIGQETHAHTQ